MSNNEYAGLYVHVPFCRTKCPYCDFYSATDLSLVSCWLEGLQKEICLYEDRFVTFDTLYLGGGTPTLLNDHELTTLMDCLFHHFSFSPDTEITIEANPDDITLGKVKFFRETGINRISLGVQSLDDNELRFLQRRHTALQAEKALEWIRDSGFANVGVDLMYGFPGQTESGWVQTMKRSLDFRPEHLSCYQMTFEERTAFGKMLAEGRIRAMEKDKEREFFLFTSSFLETNGYIHYEISNYARGLKYTSRHNCKYWRHVPYLGLGPSAHSFQGGERWWNTRSIDSYCQALGEGKLPVGGTESLSAEQHRLEMLYLGFRTREGIDCGFFHNQPQWEGILKDLHESKLVKIQGGRVIPTREGFLVADGLPLLFPD
ncbi:MAG: radical SAM family heme chaperone HemW [Proteobacteria bacterium]|nr:radical SAM family heme chaperone HemW [Pseudomonadota bacterium]